MTRRLLVLLFCLVWASPAFAVPQPIMGATTVNLDDTLTETVCPMGVNGILAGQWPCVVPAAGTFSRLCVTLFAAPQNGAGTQSYTFTVQQSASLGTPSDTPITLTISEDDTYECDSSNTQAVVAGDLVTLEVTPANTPAVMRAAYSLQFTPTTPGQQIWMTGLDTVTSTTADAYFSLSRAAASATEDDRYTIFGKACTAAALYVEVATAPDTGVGTQEYAWTTRDCGPYTAASCADTALTCTNSETARACNGATSFSVDAEDMLTVESDPSVSAPVDPDKVAIGVRCDMADVTTFNLAGSTTADVSTTSTVFLAPNSVGATASTTEANNQVETHELVVTGLWVWLSADPGTSPDAYSYTVRDDAADTNCTFNIVANNTTGEKTDCADILRSPTLLSLEISPISTPSVATMDTNWGMALQYQPRRKVVVE